jgi:hypothetical protein
MLERQKDRAFVVPAINWLYGTLYDAEAFGCELRRRIKRAPCLWLTICTPVLQRPRDQG